MELGVTAWRRPANAAENAERLKKRVLDRQLKEYALLKVRLAQLETKLNNDNGN